MNILLIIVSKNKQKGIELSIQLGAFFFFLSLRVSIIHYGDLSKQIIHMETLKYRHCETYYREI